MSAGLEVVVGEAPLVPLVAMARDVVGRFKMASDDSERRDEGMRYGNEEGTRTSQNGKHGGQVGKGLQGRARTQHS